MVMRILRKTPIAILIIAFLFFILPILSYLATADFFQLRVWEFFKILKIMQPFQLLIIVFSWLVAYGILARKKLGYYSFLGFAIAIISYNLWLIISFSLGKSFYIAGYPLTTQDLWGNFTLTFFLLTSVYYFINQEISAPYFSPESRGWRRNPRETIPLEFTLKLGNETWNSRSINISSTGAMVPVDSSFSAEEGDYCTIEIHFDDWDGKKYIGRFESVIARINSIEDLPGDKQIGLRFLSSNTTKDAKEQLNHFLRERYSPRYRLQRDIHFGRTSFDELTGIIQNVSSDGLYIHTTEKFNVGEEIFVRIPTKSGSVDMEVRVSWSNPNGEYGKEPGFGSLIVKNHNPIRFRFWLLKVRTQKMQTR
jgi:hypothetical protein